MVQPEFFHRNVDAEHLAEEAWSLLTDEPRRQAIRAKLARLPELLGPPGVLQRTAESILEMTGVRKVEVEASFVESRPRRSVGG
jgi:lipid A disaccharide synthetase